MRHKGGNSGIDFADRCLAMTFQARDRIGWSRRHRKYEAGVLLAGAVRISVPESFRKAGVSKSSGLLPFCHTSRLIFRDSFHFIMDNALVSPWHIKPLEKA
jgi:hypothetical protein